MADRLAHYVNIELRHPRETKDGQYLGTGGVQQIQQVGQALDYPTLPLSSVYQQLYRLKAQQQASPFSSVFTQGYNYRPPVDRNPPSQAEASKE